jgi:hypothetical protein
MIMNDTPTPETDENTLRAYTITTGGEFCAVHVHVSKRLERERDEWIKKVAQYAGINVGLNLDLHLAKEDLADLREQVRLTIMENLHLADGDNCTLKRLKDAIGFSLDSPENAKVEARDR